MAELPKYTADECVQQIPCRVWVPNRKRCELIDLTKIPHWAMTVDVLAHSLSSKVRYNGHTPFPYSVATHSVLVKDLMFLDCGLMLELEALLHDASEAFVGDVIHPIKRMLPDFKEIEAMVDRQIRAFYCLPEKEDPLVKEADTKALWLEQKVLQGKQFSPEAVALLQPEQMELAANLLAEELDWQTSRDIFYNEYKFIIGDLAA